MGEAAVAENEAGMESRRIRDEDSVQHVMWDPCQALVTTAGIVSTSSQWPGIMAILAPQLWFFFKPRRSYAYHQIVSSITGFGSTKEPAFSFLVSCGESDLKSSHSLQNQYQTYKQV